MVVVRGGDSQLSSGRGKRVGTNFYKDPTSRDLVSTQFLS